MHHLLQRMLLGGPERECRKYDYIVEDPVVVGHVQQAQ
jgi:hypothetical protein